MEYRPLGHTGINVSQLCLGAMMLGAAGNPDHDDAIRIVHRALDAGINFIDTADAYSHGESEQIIGKALAAGRRENVVLATKFGLPFGQDPNHRGGSRRWITQAVEGSLRRLQTDWIDVYQVHRLDPNADLDETLGALSDLVHAGKIRSFGASNVPASGIVEARWAAERRGRERFRTEQPQYSMLVRAIEYDLLPTSQRHGIGVMTYSPLAGGWLSGRYRQGQKVTGPGSAARGQLFPGVYDATNPANAAKLDAADALGALADEAGMTLIQDGDRIRHPPPSGHLRDHRPAHARTPRHLPRRRRDRTVHRSARPHRPDRPPRRHRQRRRQPVEPEHNSAGGRVPSPLDEPRSNACIRRTPPLLGTGLVASPIARRTWVNAGLPLRPRTATYRRYAAAVVLYAQRRRVHSEPSETHHLSADRG